MSEAWVPVAGYAGLYEISSLGRVRRNGILLKARPNHEGYPLIGLCKDGKRRHYTVHVLVLRSFVGPPPPGTESRHINGVRSDASLSNLAYGTKAENMADRDTHGGTVRGVKQHAAKLTEADVKVIRGLSPSVSDRQAAKIYGVSTPTLRKARIGETWGHVK